MALADADSGNGMSSLHDARRIVEIYDMHILWPDKGDVMQVRSGEAIRSRTWYPHSVPRSAPRAIARTRLPI